jgi:predicted nucleotidyltransferase
MAIPNSQLEIWAKQGAVTTAKLTHESVRTALEHEKSLIKGKAIEICLQGSYRNDTNIRGDSDVDILVELTTTFGHSAHELPITQRQAHEIAYDSANYEWKDFRRDVLASLEKYYGKDQVDSTGSKSIKLLPRPGRLKADIVPVIRYRKYKYFNDLSNYSAERGVKLYNVKTNESVVNYPFHHFKNGQSKNASERTEGLFKPIVRIIKNARSYLVQNGSLGSEKAPSYFLQNLIYNVPDEHFTQSYEQSVYNVLKYLYTTPLENFVCQNEMHPLFGDTAEQWNTTDAVDTIVALVGLWDNWQ